jgi:hypothetical protein
MIKTYNKQQVLEPLISGYPHIFEELKNKMKDDVSNGDHVKIITKTEGFPIEGIVLFTTVEDVENWFNEYDMN